MNWRRLRAAAGRSLARFRSTGQWQRELDSAKSHWLNEPPTNCPNAPLIYQSALPPTWHRILEFGANTGGNLTYFLDRHPDLQTIGIDINPIVKEPERRHAGYRGIVGDERALREWNRNEFDLAFTISVLDHIPSPEAAKQILERLIEISRQVVLLEPIIPGVHGDVSGKTRAEVARDLPNPHKRFAAHCYVWDYPRWLDRMHVSWTSVRQPLHAASLGPFYHLFRITKSGNGDLRTTRSDVTG